MFYLYFFVRVDWNLYLKSLAEKIGVQRKNLFLSSLAHVWGHALPHVRGHALAHVRGHALAFAVHVGRRTSPPGFLEMVFLLRS